MPADPIIFGKLITWYAIFTLIGIFVVGFLATKRACKFNLSPDKVVDTLLISSVGVLIGGSLLYAVTNLHHLKTLTKTESFSDLFNTMVLIFGGSVFYGGLYGGLLLGYIHLKRTGQNIISYNKTVIPLIALFHFFGRIGCFMSGCCYGVQCSVGITYFHSLYPPTNGVQRFPIQAVESIYNLLLFIILLLISNHKILSKYILNIYLILYSMARFIFEFFRGDDIRGIYFGISTSQYIAFITIIVTASVTYFTAKKEEIAPYN